jgi:hypothetical protein
MNYFSFCEMQILVVYLNQMQPIAFLIYKAIREINDYRSPII